MLPTVMLIISIICCILFSIGTIVFFVLTLVAAFSNAQKKCPACGSLVPAASAFCTHCGHGLDNAPGSKSRKFWPFLALCIGCLVATFVSIAGIAFSAIGMAGSLTHNFTMFADNYHENSNLSAWNVSYIKCNFGVSQKNIQIVDGKPSTLYVKSQNSRGNMYLQIRKNGTKYEEPLSENGDTKTIDLSKYKDGTITLVLIIKDGEDGSAQFTWR